MRDNRTRSRGYKSERNQRKKVTGYASIKFRKKKSTTPNLYKKEISKNPNSEVRLQKYISEAGVASRRAGEELILEGKVKVNGAIVTKLGTKINPLKDRVTVRNKIIIADHKGVAIFNKPKFVVSTLFDPEGRKNITDYLSKQFKSYFPVGRLDYESYGLIILTNDGELADALMHPRYQVERVYHARVEGLVNEGVLGKLRSGIRLNDGIAKAEVEILTNEKDTTWLEVKIKEGRNRLIRRLMDKIGHSVIKLNRVSHGPFKLGKLKPGEIRKFTEDEYKIMRDKLVKEV